MSNNLREAAQQALDSLLELVTDQDIDFAPAYEGAKQRRKKAIKDLRAALAEKQESLTDMQWQAIIDALGSSMNQKAKEIENVLGAEARV